MVLLVIALLPSLVSPFVTPSFKNPSTGTPYHSIPQPRTSTSLQQQQLSVQVEATLDDEKVRALFAWVARAYAGDYEYNNLMIAIAAIFGNLPEGSEPVLMAEKALNFLPEGAEEKPMGEPFSLYKRESNSLGAMGAAQWKGRWRTRPHALLQVQNFTHVDDWIQTLPRGCRRTIKRAVALEEAGSFTVRTLPIFGDQPAPTEPPAKVTVAPTTRWPKPSTSTPRPCAACPRSARQATSATRQA